MGIEKIGISDNYYQIGGDSVKAIQICARLRKH
ncbi:phosphopantetheine-binding protein [Paenibacillus larvae]